MTFHDLTCFKDDIETAKCMSASASGIASTIAGSSKHTHVVCNDDKFIPIQKQIISTLSISPGLLQPDRDIHMAYAKYTAIHEAINKLHTMKLASTWTTKVPLFKTFLGFSYPNLPILKITTQMFITTLLWRNGFQMQMMLQQMLKFGGISGLLLPTWRRFSKIMGVLLDTL